MVKALQALQDKVAVTACSTFYWTAAIDRPEQPDYLNGIFEIQTTLPVKKITSELLQPIEQQLGRVRSADRYASRTLDLDLVLYNAVRIHTAGLTLPHPDLERVFVSEPIYALLTRSGLSHPCQPDMLDLLPSRQIGAVIGRACESITHTLQVTLTRTA